MDPSSTVSFYVISASTSAVSVAAEEEKQDDPHTAVVGSASASVTAASAETATAAKKDNDPKAGIVASYGTDVMQEEPPETDDPLFSLDEVVITPHMGASTEEAHIKMMDVAMTNALDILEGKACKNIVN